MIKTAVKELEFKLLKLKNTSYDSIDSLMRKIMKKYDVTAKELHFGFVDKHNKTPDDWVKEKMKNLQESSHKKDHEGSMARVELKTIQNDSARLRKKIKSPSQQLPAWIQSKITKAADDISTAADYMENEDESLDEQSSPSFTISRNSNSTSARRRRTIEQAAANTTGRTKNEIKTIQNLLKSTQNGPDIPPFLRKESLSIVGQILSEIINEEECGCEENKNIKTHKSLQQLAKKHNTSLKKLQKQLELGINIEKEHTNDKDLATDIALHHLDEIPDYYTRLKEMEKQQNESLEYLEERRKRYPKGRRKGDPCWKNYKQVGMKQKNGREVPNCVPIEEETLPHRNGQNIFVTAMWRCKVYPLQLFFPQSKVPNKKDIEFEVQKIYPGAKVVMSKVSMIQPGMPIIQVQSATSKNYLLNNGTIGEELFREEGPSLSVSRGEKLSVDQGGGLTKKGREKYNRETGSNLQAPVTGKVKRGSKAWKRRRNFCSRSRSWKGPRGLAARRRWKC